MCILHDINKPEALSIFSLCIKYFLLTIMLMLYKAANGTIFYNMDKSSSNGFEMTFVE